MVYLLFLPHHFEKTVQDPCVVYYTYRWLDFYGKSLVGPYDGHKWSEINVRK